MIHPSDAQVVDDHFKARKVHVNVEEGGVQLKNVFFIASEHECWPIVELSL